MSQLTCHAVSWSTAAKPLCDIRRQVFIKEQNVPPELEWGEDDRQAQHFLLSSATTMPEALNSAIGCARILRESHAGTPHFHIGRVAILAHSRKQGAGSYFMRELLNWCQQQADYSHCEQVFLHAQCGVIPFYQRLGFTSVGEVFMDAGMEHRSMIWQGTP